MRRSINDKKIYKSFDIYLLMVTLMLVFVGMVMIFSSSAVSASHNYSDSYFYLKKQALFICVGLMLMFMAKNIPYKAYWKIVYPMLVLSFLSLLFVLVVGHGGTSEGVHRWIRIGPFSFQPSELTKLTTVIFVAYALAKKGEKIKEFTKGFLPVLSISGVYIVLILIQKDLGGAITLSIIVMLMLFVAGTRLTYLFGAVIASLPVLYFAIFSVAYRRKRIMAFLDPWQHQMDSGFQVIQSFVAFQSGGVTGVGLGDGKQKLFYLPEAHTDFIFSVIGEELGLIGVLVVISLFTFFIFRGLLITLKTRDLFGMYLAFGITALIGVQAFFNMAVVMGLLPTKGLALPFISYGGSSLMVSMLAVGILLNISTADPSET